MDIWACGPCFVLHCRKESCLSLSMKLQWCKTNSNKSTLINFLFFIVTSYFTICLFIQLIFVTFLNQSYTDIQHYKPQLYVTIPIIFYLSLSSLSISTTSVCTLIYLSLYFNLDSQGPPCISSTNSTTVLLKHSLVTTLKQYTHPRLEHYYKRKNSKIEEKALVYSL